jgi:hypothetical protein
MKNKFAEILEIIGHWSNERLINLRNYCLKFDMLTDKEVILNSPDDFKTIYKQLIPINRSFRSQYDSLAAGIRMCTKGIIDLRNEYEEYKPL